jgi:RNA recognition motif-containing protein
MAKNIPAEIPVAAIRTHFSKYGNVSSITLSFASSSLGCAVITYADCSSVARAAAAAAAASSA